MAEMNAQEFYKPWTWRDRLRFKLFPSTPCPLPPAPAHFEDVLHVDVSVGLDALDRMRVLVTGKLAVRTRVVCEHKPGATVSASAAYPVLRFEHE